MSYNNPENEPQSSWVPSAPPATPSPAPATPSPAPYPGSAPSAPYPPGTPSAGYPSSGYAAGSYPATTPSASQPYPAAAPAAPAAGQPAAPYGAPYAPAAPAAPAGPKTGFAALFDFTFGDYATPSIVKLVYGLAVAVNVLGWLAITFLLFAAGNTGFGRSDSTMGVLALLFGWVPALLNIATMRLMLEFYLVTLRTNQTLTELRADLKSNEA